MSFKRELLLTIVLWCVVIAMVVMIGTQIHHDSLGYHSECNWPVSLRTWHAGAPKG